MPSKTSSVRSGRFVFILRQFTALVMTGACVSTMAQIVAHPQAAPSQRPEVGKSPTGIYVVQITAPSAAGVSHNRYTRFDVDPKGVILNNNTTFSEATLGLMTAGNQNLAGRPASVILNEVTSASPTVLRGIVEVAGTPAQVVIANPTGISCQGCGFVNASRATLFTGPSLVQQVPSTSPAAGQAADPVKPAPGPRVIDASALGGMYANSIRLVTPDATIARALSAWAR